MKFLKKGKAALIATSSALSLGAFSMVQAAVPAAATQAVTDLVTDAGTFIDALWALVIAVTVGFIFIKLFQRGARTAS